MARGRSVTRNGRSKKRPFIMFPCDVYDILVAKQVGPSETSVLLGLIRRHNGVNNGHIGFPVRAGAALRLSQATTSRALKTLAQLGFITAEAPSAFSRKDRKAAEYGLAWLPIDGRPPTLGYRNIPVQGSASGPGVTPAGRPVVADPLVFHSSATDADSSATDAPAGSKCD